MPEAEILLNVPRSGKGWALKVDRMAELAKYRRLEKAIERMESPSEGEFNFRDEDRILSTLRWPCQKEWTQADGFPGSVQKVFTGGLRGRIYCVGMMALKRRCPNRPEYTVCCTFCDNQPIPWVASSKEAMAAYRVWRALNK